jgi:hypothetical protein
MKVDTDTVTIVFSLLLNSSGMGALASLLDTRDMQSITTDLRDAIKPDRTTDAPDDDYVSKKLATLSAKLFSVWMLVLHVANIALFALLAAILYVGPDQVFITVLGQTADPLAPWELVLYWVWLLFNVVAYLVTCVSPTLELFGLRRQAKKWIADYRGVYDKRKR